MSDAFKTIALVGRPGHRRVADSIATLADFLTARDITVLVDQESGYTSINGATSVPRDSIAPRSDLVVAVGGDGTMLDGASLVAKANVPLIGINRGRLGFLADISPADMCDVVASMLDGDYIRESRMMLSAVLQDGGSGTLVQNALNDVVIQRYEAGRMLEIEVHMDGVYVNTHRGDGLIVATPTGSTAYALSGGGPILAPGLDALVMVPICPHTLSDRPLVVSGRASLSLTILDRPGTRAQVTCDGRLLDHIVSDHTLTVTQSTDRVTLLHPSRHDYFRMLRSKLAWGRGRDDRNG